MKLGPVLFEAKLTESDFQTQKATIVEGYRDLKEVFDCRKLSRCGQEYVSYQLLRNVLCVRAQPFLLRAARCTAPRSSRTVVRGHEVRAVDGSQNKVHLLTPVHHRTEPISR
jgi:hypothetical protein